MFGRSRGLSRRDSGGGVGGCAPPFHITVSVIEFALDAAAHVPVPDRIGEYASRNDCGGDSRDAVGSQATPLTAPTVCRVSPATAGCCYAQVVAIQ